MLLTNPNKWNSKYGRANVSRQHEAGNEVTASRALPAYYEALRHQDSTIQQGAQKRAISEVDMQDVQESSTARKRISRACDQCNQMRSKCDGNHPCAHCVESQLICAYQRVHKKRGRVPKRDQAQVEETRPSEHRGSEDGIQYAHKQNEGNAKNMQAGTHAQDMFFQHGTSNNAGIGSIEQSRYYNGYNTSQNAPTDPIDQILEISPGIVQSTLTGFAPSSTIPFGVDGINTSGYGFTLGDDYSVGFMGKTPMVESPDWLALTTPMLGNENWASLQPPPHTVRFPVLHPILPQLDTIIPKSLACDLLEQYFATASSANCQPRNPYLQTYVFRKQSILHPTHPRPCTTALLASMLWISAQHSDASLLTTQPGARGKICQKLFELTIKMLRPLIHGHGIVPSEMTGSTDVTQIDAGLGGLVLPIDIMAGNEVNRTQVDNIMTYVHLATVVSASERKAASLRWWNTAWSLARESRLGRELPADQVVHDQADDLSSRIDTRQNQFRGRAASAASSSTPAEVRTSSRTISEEDREERRRAWWLLYMMDRHLALCYNRPMFFLNKECEGLLQPLDDSRFQLGLFEHEVGNPQPRGLDIKCTSLSVFGFFLPLMVILGEILDLNHARHRPRFGPRAKHHRDFSDTVTEIEEHLNAFAQSQQTVTLNSQTSPSTTVLDSSAIPKSKVGNTNKLSLHYKVVVAYGTHIMHVLHILLTGKWDPIALLDDNDLWISSQAFVNATGHAVSAAKALADIIDCDPDLSFMPYFFGIYLLQGSFLLMLFADKLQDNITRDVVEGCETIVRAHEACISTLDNQYQRNFRKVMRSALRQLRGHMHEDATEQQNWRREILKLYRWTGDGTGLAL